MLSGTVRIPSARVRKFALSRATGLARILLFYAGILAHVKGEKAMKRELWKMFSLLTVCLTIAAPALRAEDTVGTEDPDFHGMLVIGTGTIYISHLPIFVLPHRYQGLWEVSFGDEADHKYREARRRPENAGRIFTLAPGKDFRLPELSTSRDSFPADVYAGHFERGGKVLLENVTVTLKQRIHWHPFRNRHTRSEQLSYLLFGEGDERYISHWITVAPSYHQILAVTVDAPNVESTRGVQVVLPDRSDGDRLKAGESVAGLAIIDGDPEQPIRVRPIELRVDSEYYLEQGELKDNGLGETE